ncbi:hypothetical protein Rsub_06082 [Raphidocelis subcapitata]|uniref:Uncharacterized protein n=1 Tax=Raphidocelis subcapitata TaxID=307507 RepID=A0A2V0P7C5_9CHLO|nr:hypothetical protein Rsub_06082 [Raphidocelis subcapitata]|eukprot:GBF93750.1 hypothetical protein Rsub_06082 [Raphidocelis subcapitata]
MVLEPYNGGGAAPWQPATALAAPAARTAVAAAAAAAACQHAEHAGAAGEAPAAPAAASAFEEEWRVMSVTYPSALLHHEGKRINLHELVCGNFVGVRGRKLEAIRSQLGSAGYHLRVNHALVEADERLTYVSIQVSVLGLVMDSALRLLLDSFAAAAHGVLTVHPRAGEIRVAATIAGAEVRASITARGVAQTIGGVLQAPAPPAAPAAAPAMPAARPRTPLRPAVAPAAPPVAPTATAASAGPATAPAIRAPAAPVMTPEQPRQPPFERDAAAQQQLQSWGSVGSLNSPGAAPLVRSAASSASWASSPQRSVASTPSVSRSSSSGSSSGGSSGALLPVQRSLGGASLDGAATKGGASADDFLAKLLLGSDLLALL